MSLPPLFLLDSTKATHLSRHAGLLRVASQMLDMPKHAQCTSVRDVEQSAPGTPGDPVRNPRCKATLVPCPSCAKLVMNGFGPPNLAACPPV